MLAGNTAFIREYPIATKRVLRAIPKVTDLCVAEPERVARRLVERISLEAAGLFLDSQLCHDPVLIPKQGHSARCVMVAPKAFWRAARFAARADLSRGDLTDGASRRRFMAGLSAARTAGVLGDRRSLADQCSLQTTAIHNE
jgi:hypothetical protein